MGLAASVLEVPLRDPGRVMLVTAHPDDESFFFAPTVQSLRAEKLQVMLLCLSNGNAAGLGKVREGELRSACNELRIKYFKVINDAELQDGPRRAWDEHLVASLVAAEVRRCRISTVITFDRRGVTRHANHCAVYRGVLQMLKDDCVDDLTVYVLRSPTCYPLALLGLLGIIPSSIKAHCSRMLGRGRRKNSTCCITRDPRQVVQAMRHHRSQWVWYRKFFAILSTYTFVNHLTVLDH